MTAFYRDIIKEVFGCIPEIPEVYRRAVQYYNPATANPEAIPYVWKALYTEDEAEMLHALPGSPEEVAAKTGFDRDYIEKSLSKLADAGMAMYAPSGFVRLPPVVTMLFDHVFFSHEGRKEPYSARDLAILKLIRFASISRAGLPPEQASQAPFRVIPKYDSIKNVPGVMPCEDMKEILVSNASAGTLATDRCICKVLDSMWNKGAYPAEGDDNPDYLQEGGCNECGHCIHLGENASYVKKFYHTHAPDAADAEKKLEELEKTIAVYVCPDNRLPVNICCCHFDYCVPKALNAWAYRPSRFRPVKKAGKCIGCGMCARVCQFEAIDKNGFINLPDKCVGCGNCVTKCGMKALKMELVHTPDWIPD